ncbi:uncharacterized protein LOC109812500 [Cajanus cajan]|uniref:uncharacterized protein LOC109812500 n=1 Tax=Cajanus cajan TaxID=3821 RepID=UPI00098D84CF|nr:uncharacterized protein LOC109812500 [Cajanus cajan]
MFYDESVLLTIASAIRKPIKVDLNTLNMTRGRFARVCVEINLNEPVVGRFFLNGVWYNVECEGLHLMCSSCGCYGNVLRNCLKVARPEATAHDVGEKEAVEQPSGDTPQSADSAAQPGKNRKQNIGKPWSKGKYSLHNGIADSKEKNQAIPNYPTRGIQFQGESREGFNNPREVLVTTIPREQRHAQDVCSTDVGHGKTMNETATGPNKENKKRSRVETLGARPRPMLVGGNTLSEHASSPLGDPRDAHDGVTLGARPRPMLAGGNTLVAHAGSSLGDPRDAQDGVIGDVDRRLPSNVTQTGCMTQVVHELKDSGQVIPGTEDFMQFDPPLEEEDMLA